MDVARYMLLMLVILKELPNTGLDEGRCLVLEPKECILHVPQGTLFSPVVSWVGVKAAATRGSVDFSVFQAQLSQQCRRIYLESS